MPTVELVMMNASAASGVMALAGAGDKADSGEDGTSDEGAGSEGEAETDTANDTQTEVNADINADTASDAQAGVNAEADVPSSSSSWVLYLAIIAGVIILAAIAAAMLIRRCKHNRNIGNSRGGSRG